MRSLSGLKSILRKIPYPLRILTLFFGLSMIHLYPILKNFFSMLPYATNGDISLLLTILTSNIQNLSHLQFSQIYHLPILFPLSYTLTIGTTLFGQSVLLLPVFLLGISNVYPVYNAVTIFSYVAAGYGAYLFFKELQDSEAVSIISASLYMLLPFRVYNIPHLNMMFNFPIPLCFFFLLRYLKNSRKKDLVYFNVFLLSQYLFDLSLGFFLSISLAFFVLVYVLTMRPTNGRTLLGLFVSLLPTIGIVLLVHLPFLQKGVSLSPSGSSFNPGQYSSALSFYSNKSTLLYLLNRTWDPPLPLFAGFSVAFFYIFAFSSFVSKLRDRILLAVMVGAYAVPSLLAFVFSYTQAYGRIEAPLEWGLLVFFVSLAVLLISARKKISRPLKLVSVLLLVLIFISFDPFPRIFDLFNALAKFLPFLHRSRGVRTYYIVPLLTIGLFAFGLKAFLEKKRDKKVYLWAVVLVLLLEHFRWPVMMAKLPALRTPARSIYRMMDSYPDFFGILELPFLPIPSNAYSLLTRYHKQHTYHGYSGIYADTLDLAGEKELRVNNRFRGLRNPGLIEKFKDNGLYLILIHRVFLPAGDKVDPSALWQGIRKNALAGQELGLVKEIKEQDSALLIVLDDERKGPEITYPIPYFALVGRTQLQFKLQTSQRTQAQFFFNDHLIAVEEYPAGKQVIVLDIQTAPKQTQINRLRVVSDHPVSVRDLRMR